MIGPGPVEAGALHEQNFFGQQQVQDEPLVIDDPVNGRIDTRERVQRSAWLHTRYARNIVEKFPHHVALLVQPAAGQHEAAGPAVIRKRGPHGILARDVGAQPHVRQDVEAFNVAGGMRARTGDNHPAGAEAGESIGL